MASGFSGFTFNILSKFIVNPNNIEANIEVKTGKSTMYYYNEEVYKNVP